MDVELTLIFKACKVHFTFRKQFSAMVKSAGWPKNALKSAQILALPETKKFVKFSCALQIHSVLFNEQRVSNEQYMKFKTLNPRSLFSLTHPHKPNGGLLRW